MAERKKAEYLNRDGYAVVNELMDLPFSSNCRSRWAYDVEALETKQTSNWKSSVCGCWTPR